MHNLYRSSKSILLHALNSMLVPGLKVRFAESCQILPNVELPGHGTGGTSYFSR